MSSPFYFYIPNDDAIKEDNTLNTPFLIFATNVEFSNDIPVNYLNRGSEAFVQFLKSHPLRYARANSVEFFLPQHVCEFSYTYTYDDQTDIIQGTICNGDHVIHLYVSILRDALCLPNLMNFLDSSSEKQWRKAIMKLGYDSFKQGKHSSLILCQCLSIG